LKYIAIQSDENLSRVLLFSEIEKGHAKHMLDKEWNQKFTHALPSVEQKFQLKLGKIFDTAL
jgi:hypothetical protein